jgi:Tfp pilus assembly protein PilN
VNGGAVNLARRPFANTRPLRRVAMALWLVGSVLAVVVAVLYWRSLFGIEGGREDIADVDRAITDEQRRLEASEAALERLDLRRQNVEAAYLAARIRERTFPWSALFVHLAEVLPRQVRLVSLSPQSEQRDESLRTISRHPGSAVSAGRVYLQMTGAAANDEALTQLLDRLFASQRFSHPTLPIERREPEYISFALRVSYLPPGPSARRAGVPAPASPSLVEAGRGAAAPPAGGSR